jgi:predicted nucleic acid-binding protein
MAMANYLLDTNHISPLITLEHPLRAKVLSRFQAGDAFAIATPALSEFLFGIGILPRAKQNFDEWERLKSDFIYYNIDLIDAEQAAKLRLALRQQGLQLNIIDALVAVVALRNDLTVLTTDRDFQNVPGLNQENWR